MSLYQKYRPKTLSEMVGNEEVIKSIREHFSQEDPSRISHCHIFYGSSGTGKAQPLYSKVLTPTGWTTMGDIKPGDSVISGDGKPTKVLSIFPQGSRPVYAIQLDDGTEVHVADNHLNVVSYKKQHKHKGKSYVDTHTDVVTTTDLIPMVKAANAYKNDKCLHRIYIPNVKIDYEVASNLPINPYLLGILIGDGSLHGNFYVSLPERDVYTHVSNLLKEEGFVLNKVTKDPCNYDYRIARDVNTYMRPQDMKNDADNLKNKVRNLHLDVKSVDKHIPNEYLNASFLDRLELLRGLFDSDGHVSRSISKKGYECIHYEFSTSSTQLSQDFADLVRSLGITDTIKSKIPHYIDSMGNKVECHISYRHHLKVPNGLIIANSEKHLAKIKDRECGNALKRCITGIRYVGDIECQCIYVEAPCHTYVTDNYTLTHNTTIARAIATEILGADPTFGIHEINTADNRGIETARGIIDQMKGFPLKGKATVYLIDEAHGMTADAKRAFLKPTEDMPKHVYFFFCTTNLAQFIKGDEGKALNTRSTQWKLEALNARQLGKLVLRTADAENFNVDDKVLSAIVDVADGSPRAALVALEKVMGIPDDIPAQLKILEKGGEEDPDTMAFCRAVCNNRPNWKEISELLRNMKGKVDAEQLRRGVLGYCTSIMLKNSNDHVAHVMEEFAVDTFATGFPGIVLAAYRCTK